MSGSARKKRPRITAHRGLSWECPENTMPSYQAAIAEFPDYVELDYYTSRDGILFCMHDYVLDRYLAGQHPEYKGRPLNSFTLAELQQLDLGTWKHPKFAGIRIATLREVAELFAAKSNAGPCPELLLEHKTGSVDQTLDILKVFSSSDHYVVMSFDWNFLKELHARAPHIALVALGGGANLTAETIREMKSFGAMAAHWNDQITRSQVQLLHDVGMEAWIYTLNTELAFYGALAIGLDAVTTDRCDFARVFFNSHPL